MDDKSNPAAVDAIESDIMLEVLARVIHQAMSGEKLKTIEEVVKDLGITPEDLEAAGDVEIESD